MKWFHVAAVLFVFAAAILPAPAAPTTTITLYSSLSYGPATARAFTRATGIVVRVVSARETDILAHIKAEGRHPYWSLAWFDGAASASALDGLGLLAHDLPPPPALTPQAAALMPASGAWVPTGITLAGVVVLAADPYVAPPRGWPGLAASAYHGILGLTDPGVSTESYDLLAGLLQAAGGWPQGSTFLATLKRDGLHIYASRGDTLAALRSGSVELAIMNSALAFEAAKDQASGLRLAFPSPVSVMPSVIVMARGLNPAQRRAVLEFIAFANEATVQELRMRSGADGWYWPVVKGLSAHAGLPPLAGLNPITLDASAWGRLQPQILRWFDRKIVED